MNYRYLAPPTAVVIIFGSLVAGFFNPLLFIPSATYGAAIIVGALAIGKSIAEKLILPIVLATIHIVWGLGYLTSPPGLIAEEE